ncbi:MAG: fatty acid desaturase [Vulcanococcus sp.]
MIHGLNADRSRLISSLLLTSTILFAWVVSLFTWLLISPHQLGWWGLFLSVLIRVQLQTGLFIVAHDAMHGVLWRGQPRWNDGIGAFALGLYAGLSYKTCRRNHHRHHQRTATSDDPDFPSDRQAGFWWWYAQFMTGYLSWRQMLTLLSGWAVLGVLMVRLNPSVWSNLLLFCVVPLLLSSLQLFLFGTYLPHRCQRRPQCAVHPRSLHLPAWLSLLTCFHFGYHREHHDHPGLSWFELPLVRARHGSSLTFAAAIR